MKNKKSSITVGIPAYNEEQNIGNLLESVLKQKQFSFHLEKILVICDGSSDSTPDIVKSFQQKYPVISVSDHKTRMGKTKRLNEIYESNTSDYLLTLDGDIVLGTDNEIEKVLPVALKTGAQVVALHQIPQKVHGFIKRILYANHCLWSEICFPINGGNHISNLQGSATLISKEFAKQVHYPIGIPCDQAYLYVKARQKNTFAFSPANQVIYQPLGTFSDWNRLNKRISSERYSLQTIFGEDITNFYNTSRSDRLRGLFIQIKKDPVFTTLAYGMNIIFKFIIPFQKPNVGGAWPTLTSTKGAIETKEMINKVNLIAPFFLRIYTSNTYHHSISLFRTVSMIKH